MREAIPKALALADRRRNLDLEARAQARRDEASLEASLAQTARLARGRGEAMEQPASPGGPRRPMRRISGLQWLLSKGRITPLQAQAGERYGALAARVMKGEMGSSLKERVGGPMPGSPGEARMAAIFAKDGADWAIRGGLPEAVGRDLIRLCQTVCGETATVREAAGGDRQAADRMEVQLGLCLDLLAVHFGLTPKARRQA